METRSRGRPKGHKLSTESKRKIAESRTGQKHTEPTKQKISKTLTKYFIDNPTDERHRLSLSPTLGKWHNMKNRCCDPNNKNYKYYGAKGIKMCDEWQDFINFHTWLYKNDWRKGLHIHRVDPAGNYSPDNCVLLTPSEHSKLHAIERNMDRLYQDLEIAA